jgi:hypothetical protein
MPDPALKDLARTVAQANKDYQYALRVYTERLEDEVRAVDKLLVTIVVSVPRSLALIDVRLTESRRSW